MPMNIIEIGHFAHDSSVAVAPSPFGAYNRRVSGSGFQPSPKSPSATSDTRQTLGEIGRWLKKKILKVEEIYIYEYEAKAV